MSIVDEYFQSGLEAYNANNYKSAETAFKKVLELEPYSSETLLNLGNVYYKQENLDMAEERWRQAIEVNPMEEKAYLNLGNLYFARNEYTRAIYYWEIFQRLRPTHANIHLNLGMAYEAILELPKAYKCYRVFLKSKNVAAEAFNLKRRMAEAERIAEHNVRQAEKCLKAGNLQKAKQAYELSVTLMPLHPKIYQHYATVLYQLGEFKEASNWYERAYALMSDDPSVLINLGILYEKQEKPFYALWAYSTAIKMDPRGISGKIISRFKNLWDEQGPALMDKAMEQVNSYINRNQHDEAEKLCQRLFDVAFTHATNKLAEIKTTLKFLEDRKEPKKLAANIAYSMAEDYKASGQYEKSLQLYNRYLDLMPDGEKAAEAKDKIQQIEKAISAVIGSLLEGETSPQTAA